MKVIINIILAFALLSLLSGCQKSFSLPQGFVASIETLVSADMAGSFHIVSREIEGVELDLSQPTYVIIRIQARDEISYEGKLRYVRWVTLLRFQEGQRLKVVRDANR